MRNLMSKRVAIVGGFALVALALVTFQPGLRMGFYLDDYNYLERAGRTDWSNALVQIFDPRVQTMWYRPLQAIQFFIEFQIFRGDANLYHLVNIGYHVLNTLLLYALVWRISKKWFAGFAAAFFYATFPVYVSGINWIGIVDPLMTVWYLATLWWWWIYLEKRDALHYALALFAFVLALLSKQTSISLPLILFLMEWWLYKSPLALPSLLRRYAPFLAIAVAFSAVQYLTQSTHTFAGVFGWQLGATMAYILLQYLVLFFFPYGVFPSIDLNLVQVGDLTSYAWAFAALAILVLVAWKRRSRALVFLGIFALVNLIPVLPFPFIEHRYLYLPLLAAATLLGLLAYQARGFLFRNRWLASASAAALALLVIGNGLSVNESAMTAAEWARQLRVPFRDIQRQHSSFAPDTYLYFIDPITPTIGGLGGMFFLQYGRGVLVNNWTEYAGLRDHNAAFVYYFDEMRRPRELPVPKEAVTRISQTLPINFTAPIRLDGYEVVATEVKQGDPLVLVFYWRARSPLDVPYTVFVHLEDANGKRLAGYDSQPRKGTAPTTMWEPNRLYADAIVMPLADVPPGTGYKLKVGLYNQQTQERLGVVDSSGQEISDAITIEPFSVIAKQVVAQ